ncbi:MAG: hypothetical protein J3K34DRAFT_455812 [Monoraphidium minutum]|nr:MAG: hypothetical protein J3K34DRAFT_455812 [Monoraphidium minutum]
MGMATLSQLQPRGDSCTGFDTSALVVPAARAGPLELRYLTKRLKDALSVLTHPLVTQHPETAAGDCSAAAQSSGRDQAPKAAHAEWRAPAHPAPQPQQPPPPQQQQQRLGYDPEYLEACYEDEPKGYADWKYPGGPGQPELDAHGRLVLVDWLSEVAGEFRLSQATLFLTVRLMDRYLAAAPPVARGGLQLVGVAALWLACKADEAYPPVLADFVDVTQAACGCGALVEMEATMLAALGWRLHAPTAHTFLGLFLPAAAANAADHDALLSEAIDGGAGGACGGGGGGCGSESDDGSDAACCSSSDGSSDVGGGRCSSDSSSSSSSGGGGGGGAWAASGGDRLPPANARTGPRAAPRYPYATGSPCPEPAAPAGKAPAAGGPPPPAVPPVPPAALGDFPRRVGHLAEYLLELSLLTPEVLRFPPSLVAAAALRLACALLGAPPGARARLAPAAEGAAARAGPGGEERLAACVGELRRMFRYAARAPRPPLIRAKYASPRRGRVSTLPVPDWAGADA